MLQTRAVLWDHSLRDTGPATRSRGERAPDPEVQIGEMDTAEAADLARDPEVLMMTPVMPITLIAPFDEPGPAPTGAATWGVSAVGAAATGLTGAGVKVAVLDTGIDATHPAFAGMSLVQRDFTATGDGDGNGHGTHCAGTIFGSDVDGTRIGVAPGVTDALIGKVLADDGSGSSEMIFSAISWAAEAGADVISMSLGFDFPGLVERLIEAGWPADLATSAALEGYRGNLRMFDALMDLIRARAAFGSGTLVIAAAGNESRRGENPDFEIAAGLPAAATGVISVAAAGEDPAGNESRRGENPDFEIAAGLPAAATGVISVAAAGEDPAGWRIADFSNTFATITGPGVNILSANAGGGLRSLRGTSMACPHVAGVAALLWEQVRGEAVPRNAATVEARLRSRANTTGFAPGTQVPDRGLGMVSVGSGQGAMIS